MSVHMRANGTWFVAYRDDTRKQHTQNTGKGEVGKRAAEALDYEIKARKKRGLEVKAPNNGVYTDDLCQMYIDLKKAEGKGGKGWLKDFASILNNHILPGLPMKPVNQLTEQEILRFMSEKYGDPDKHSASTFNRYMSYLKVIFNFGVDRGHTDRNPLEKWKKPNEKPRQSTLTFRQLKKIKKKAAKHLQWALDVAFHLGVRTGESELLALRWEHVDWELNEIRVFAPKTNTYRTIPISEIFMRELNRKMLESKSGYIVEYRGRPIKSLRKSFRTACEKAGIDKSVTSYDVRHLFATTLLNKGGDLASVSNMMGHASTKMTADQYYHVLKSEKARTVKLLPNL